MLSPGAVQGIGEFPFDSSRDGVELRHLPFYGHVLLFNSEIFGGEMQRLSGQKMAVKRAIALADLSAVEPTCKCLNRREEISKLGPSWERNGAEEME